MNSNQRFSLTIGIILILLGIFFVVIRFIPGLDTSMNALWPFFIIGAGAVLLIIGASVGSPEMAIPAFIVAGIGGILYFQNSITHDFSSWSYMWTLIPGFVGLGEITSYLMGSRNKNSLRSGLNTLTTSLIMFLVFGAFFGAFRVLGDYWPLVLVAAGLLLLFRSFFKPSKRVVETTVVETINVETPKE
ncbi:MAG TPA: hypothetical protein VN376_02490 [Longilinea sp.]|nr:hypothetical protein [Longilinea sp.]